MNVERILNRAVYWLEVVTAAALVVLTGLAIAALAFDVFQLLLTKLALDPVEFNRIIGVILEIFILIELFRIALAYMRHRNVLPTVLEAALVAVARKFVVFEVGTDVLAKSLGLSALLLAVAISWWILSRANACELAPEAE